MLYKGRSRSTLAVSVSVCCKTERRGRYRFVAGKVLNEHSIGEVIDFKKFAAFTKKENELKIWTILFSLKKV
jgi:hypothetical protein